MGNTDQRIKAVRRQRKGTTLRAAVQDFETKRLIAAVNRAFATEDGMRALLHIMRLCGWQVSSVGGKPDIGADVYASTLYDAARRDVYIELRSIIREDILKQVEFYQENKSQDGGGNSNE
jgi:hypothetical protein